MHSIYIRINHVIFHLSFSLSFSDHQHHYPRSFQSPPLVLGIMHMGAHIPTFRLKSSQAKPSQLNPNFVRQITVISNTWFDYLPSIHFHSFCLWGRKEAKGYREKVNWYWYWLVLCTYYYTNTTTFPLPFSLISFTSDYIIKQIPVLSRSIYLCKPLALLTATVLMEWWEGWRRIMVSTSSKAYVHTYLRDQTI